MLQGCGGSSDVVQATPTARYIITGKVSNPDTGGGMPEVAVVLAGDQNQTAKTDGNGDYCFTVPDGEYRVTPTIGDTTFVPSDSVLEVTDAHVNGIDFLVSPPQAGRSVNAWRMAGYMTYKRAYQTATLLADGRVLVAGGKNFNSRASAELYDPATDKWTTTGYMNHTRLCHTETRLADGKVLVAGGYNSSSQQDPIASAELYDPSTGKWTLTGALNISRGRHAATLLADGKVLVTGGANDESRALASTELFDPATGKWSVIGSLNQMRYSHTATVLNDGKILVTGGEAVGFPSWATERPTSAEIYDPGTSKWSTTGSMTSAHSDHTATLLADGRVLVVGGYGANERVGNGIVEIYDPGTGGWTTTSSLTYSRVKHSATLLSNHKILVTGGSANLQAPRATSELYDPANGTWSTVGELKYARYCHTATLLNDGTVIVAGGKTDNGTRASTELFYSGN